MEAGPGAGGWGGTRARERLTLSYLQPRKRRELVTGGKKCTPCNVTNGRSGLASCSLAAILTKYKYGTLSELLCFLQEGFPPLWPLSGRCVTTVPPKLPAPMIIAIIYIQYVYSD